MKKLFVAGAIAIAFMTTPALAADKTFAIDNTHARIGFGVTHMVISSVKGEFKKYEGSFTLGDHKELKSASATIETASIDTGVEKRDNHLRSPDFFNADEFDTITFNSTSISHSGNDYTVLGDLTIKDITKKVTLRGKLLGVITDPWGKTRAGFTARGTIDRRDFGLTWNKALETGGLVVGNEVTLELDVEGVEAAPGAPASE